MRKVRQAEPPASAGIASDEVCAARTLVGARGQRPNEGWSRSAIDAHVGARIHKRRLAVGLTLLQLGRLIEVSQTQVHKFERGKNRVSAALLYEIGCVLDAPISYFFDGLGDAATDSAVPRRRTLTEAMQSFSKIQNEKHQEAFSQLVRILAER